MFFLYCIANTILFYSGFFTEMLSPQIIYIVLSTIIFIVGIITTYKSIKYDIVVYKNNFYFPHKTGEEIEDGTSLVFNGNHYYLNVLGKKENILKDFITFIFSNIFLLLGGFYNPLIEYIKTWVY